MPFIKRLLAIKPAVAIAVAGLCLAAGFGARLALIAKNPQFSFPDETWYFSIAVNLADRNAYVCDVPRIDALRQAPGLPFVLGALGKVMPLTPFTAKAANAVFGILTALLYGWAAWRLTASALAAGLTVAAAALHPPFLFMTTTNYPNALQALLIAALTAAFAGSLRRPAAAGAGLAHGALTGLGALAVPTCLFLLPALVLAQWTRQSFAATVRYGLLLTAGFALVVAPWAIRNAIVVGEFIPFSTSGGEQLFLGFNEQAGMNTGANLAYPADVTKLVDEGAPAKVIEHAFSAHAKNWIKENPGRAARLWALKAANFFRWDTGKLHTQSEQGGAARLWLTRLVSLATYGVFLAGVVLAWRRERALMVFALGALLFTAIGYAFFISRYRYRLPLEPFMLFAGITGIVRHLQEIHAHDRST